MVPTSRTLIRFFHEMIPGHELQGFMTARYYPYRSAFSTPFWSEGGAFYWETIFWDLGYQAKTPGGSHWRALLENAPRRPELFFP